MIDMAHLSLGDIITLDVPNDGSDAKGEKAPLPMIASLRKYAALPSDIVCRLTKQGPVGMIVEVRTRFLSPCQPRKNQTLSRPSVCVADAT